MLGAGLLFAGVRRQKAAKQGPAATPGNRRGVAAFVLFVAASVLIGGTAVYFFSWDHVLADRRNPETEDAYANGDYTPLSARVAGYVSRVLVDDNQQVRAGQVLMVLENDNFAASVRQAEAGVEAARAALAQIVEQERSTRDQVRQAEAGTSAMRAQQAFAADEAVRQRIVVGTDLGVPRMFQQAVAERRRMAAQTAAQGSVVVERRRSLDVLAAQAEGARARIAELEAELALARIQFEYATIRAPFDGVVGQRSVRVGDLVRAGGEVIPITPLSNVWVTATFAETQITDIRVGQVARVRFDAFPTVDLVGHVVGLSPLTGQQETDAPPDNTTGNYTKVVQRVPVKVVLDMKAGDPLWGVLRPGLSALVRVETNGPATVQTAR